MKETKHERFCRVVEKRMATLIDDFEKLGNCSAKVSYEYSEEELQQIYDELEFQMSRLKERFNGKQAFSLSADSGKENTGRSLIRYNKLRKLKTA